MFVCEKQRQIEFSYELTIQLFAREGLWVFLRDAGFEVTVEYGSYQGEPYATAAPKWIVIAEKRA